MRSLRDFLRFVFRTQKNAENYPGQEFLKSRLAPTRRQQGGEARARFLLLDSLLGAAVILAIHFDDGCTKLDLCNEHGESLVSAFE